MPTYVEWDPNKEIINIIKHGVHFSEAATVLEDEYALTIEDILSNEQRFITLGVSDAGRILVVVYTYRGEVIRIISTRKATASERETYKER